VICLRYSPLCCSVTFSVELGKVMLVSAVVSAVVIALVLPIHEFLNVHRVVVSASVLRKQEHRSADTTHNA